MPPSSPRHRTNTTTLTVNRSVKGWISTDMARTLAFLFVFLVGSFLVIGHSLAYIETSKIVEQEYEKANSKKSDQFNVVRIDVPAVFADALFVDQLSVLCGLLMIVFALRMLVMPLPYAWMALVTYLVLVITQGSSLQEQFWDNVFLQLPAIVVLSGAVFFARLGQEELESAAILPSGNT